MTARSNFTTITAAAPVTHTTIWQSQLKWILASIDKGASANAHPMNGGGQSGEDINGASAGYNKALCTPQIKNHTATLYNKKLYVFGGYDGKKNHSNLRVFDTETL